MYCPNCKKEIKGKAKFCTNCGSVLVQEQDQSAGQRDEIPPSSSVEDEQLFINGTGHDTKTVAALMYLTIFLFFFLEEFRKPFYIKNELVRFHLNQAIVLQIIFFAACSLPLPDFLKIILFLIVLLGSAYGMYEALTEKMNGIPYISRIKFYK